jgi:hypothetical protein
MANNATNYAKYASPDPSSFMGSEWGGKVRATHDTYTFASAAANTEVNVGVLMPGEVFLTGWIIGADLGSATTLKLGDAGDDDRYLAATVFTTAGQCTQCAKAEGVGYKNTTTSPIPLVLKTGTEEATGAVEVVVLKAAAN